MSCDYEYVSKKAARREGNTVDIILCMTISSQYHLKLLPGRGAHEPKTVGSLCRIAAVNARAGIK